MSFLSIICGGGGRDLEWERVREKNERDEREREIKREAERPID